jgi:hypothetical protein
VCDLHYVFGFCFEFCSYFLFSSLYQKSWQKNYYLFAQKEKKKKKKKKRLDVFFVIYFSSCAVDQKTSADSFFESAVSLFPQALWSYSRRFFLGRSS